jgi:hypothetical protein
VWQSVIAWRQEFKPAGRIQYPAVIEDEQQRGVTALRFISLVNYAAVTTNKEPSVSEVQK